MEKSSYNSMLNQSSHRPTPTKLLESYQQIQQQQQQQPQMLDQQQQQFNGIFFRSVSNSRVLIEASPQINAAFASYTGLIDETATNSDYSNLRSFILNSSSSSQIQQNREDLNDLNADYNRSGLNCPQQDSDLLFLKDKNIDSNRVCFNG